MSFNFLDNFNYDDEGGDLDLGDTDTSGTETNSGAPLPILYNAEQMPANKAKERPGLKRLQLKHRKIIAMHLSGIANSDIAQRLGCSASLVNNTLRDPLAQSVISEFTEGQGAEFARLEVLAINSLRDAMQPYKRDSVRLKAAQTFFNRKKDMGESANDTAEDVMANLLTVIKDSNVQINLVGGQPGVIESYSNPNIEE
jgi:hypothetical protein